AAPAEDTTSSDTEDDEERVALIQAPMVNGGGDQNGMLQTAASDASGELFSSSWTLPAAAGFAILLVGLLGYCGYRRCCSGGEANDAEGGAKQEEGEEQGDTSTKTSTTTVDVKLPQAAEAGTSSLPLDSGTAAGGEVNTTTTTTSA